MTAGSSDVRVDRIGGDRGLTDELAMTSVAAERAPDGAPAPPERGRDRPGGALGSDGAIRPICSSWARWWPPSPSSSRWSSWSCRRPRWGGPRWSPLLFRSLTAQLLWNTVSLTVVVTVPLRHGGHAGGLVRRAHRHPGPPLLGRPGGDPPGHTRLRGELRLAGHLPVLRRLLGRRPGHDRWPSTRWSSCRWRPACATPIRPRRRWRGASAWAGCAPSGGSRWARPAWPSSGGRCWSPWWCWPSSAPSRSSASAP